MDKKEFNKPQKVSGLKKSNASVATATFGNNQKNAVNNNNNKAIENSSKENYALGKLNFMLIAAGVVVVLIGLFLMAGGQSTPQKFDPSVFSAIHIKVAPVVTLIGFLSIILAIIIKPKDK